MMNLFQFGDGVECGFQLKPVFFLSLEQSELMTSWAGMELEPGGQEKIPGEGPCVAAESKPQLLAILKAVVSTLCWIPVCPYRKTDLGLCFREIIVFVFFFGVHT
jgi:hypothetical protein